MTISTNEKSLAINENWIPDVALYRFSNQRMHTFSLPELASCFRSFEVESVGCDRLKIRDSDGELECVVQPDCDASDRNRSFRVVLTNASRKVSFWACILSLLRSQTACLVASTAKCPLYAKKDAIDHFPESLVSLIKKPQEVTSVKELMELLKIPFDRD